MYTNLIRKQLNREHAIKLLRRAIGVPSVTGTELAFANFVADELRRVGAADVHTEEFLPGRANAGCLSRQRSRSQPDVSRTPGHRACARLARTLGRY